MPKKYKLKSGGGVIDTTTGGNIPESSGNRHWRKYQEWLAEGNTPDPEYTEEELNKRAEEESRALHEKKINREMRRIAIENLKKSGDLPPDYKSEIRSR